MRRSQGHELLLDAVELLPDGSPLVVALAGDGPLRPWLESRVAASDELAARVRFVHRHDDPIGLLAAGRHRAAHRPVRRRTDRAAAGDGGRHAGGRHPRRRRTGDRHVGDRGAGPAAAGPIADALVALATDPVRRERMGAAARARFLAEFEAVGWARRLNEVYESVLDRGASKAS